MPVIFTTTFGARIQTKIIDGNAAEIIQCKHTDQSISHEFFVKWRSGRPGSILIESKIVQGQNITEYSSLAPLATEWHITLNALTSSQSRNQAAPLSFPGAKGQSVLDCGTVSAWDVWAQKWVPTYVPAQLSLTVA